MKMRRGLERDYPRLAVRIDILVSELVEAMPFRINPPEWSSVYAKETEHYLFHLWTAGPDGVPVAMSLRLRAKMMRQLDPVSLAIFVETDIIAFFEQFCRSYLGSIGSTF